jgi:predicted permease
VTSRDRAPAADAAIVLYALILRLYPREFRDRCGEPMLATFGDASHETLQRGIWAFTRETAAEFATAIAGIWRSRGTGGERPPVEDRVPGVGRLTAFLQDAGYALRRLRSQPAIVLFTILSLGFAIAANAAIFSIVDAVLLRPSPFRDAGQLYNLLNRAPNAGFTFPGLSRQKQQHWRTETDIFETVEAYRPLSVLVTGGVEPEELPGAQMSPGLLTTLGAAPRHGRLFTPEEGRAGAPRVVLVSEKYWRSRLGADPAAVGRQLIINDQPHTVIGVLPARFHFPTLREEIWLPLDPDARPGPGEGAANTIVRLTDGLTLQSAQSRIAAAVARLERERPLPTGWAIVLHQGMLAGSDEQTRRAVLILFGAVGLILLTACANVANLLLSRAVDRQREFAIRLVLGASRGRLFRELMLEGLVLGLAAGAAGLAAASWAIDNLVRLAPPTLMDATTTSIGVEARVILFGLALSVLTGVLCNLPPALRSWRAQGNQALSGRTKAGTATPLQRRLRGGLVVAEIALAVVLLIGAALMLRSFMKLNAIDIGFNPDKLLAVTIGLDTGRYQTEAARESLLRRVAHDVAQLPGVSGVALASGLPPSPGTIGLGALHSEAGPCGGERVNVVLNLVTAEYFGLMGIPVPEGRALRDDDPPDAVVVSRAVAQMCGGSLVGRRLRLDARAPWLNVVGISGDVKTKGLTSDTGDVAVYLPFTADVSVLPMVATMRERPVVSRRVLIRADRPMALVHDVKRLVWAQDPNQPVLQAVPAAELMADSIRRERFMLALMTLFSAVALSLASAGIFGVLAYIVAQRTNEIGIRMALGATGADVLRLVVGQGLRLAALGVAVGLAGAFAVSKLLAGLLYEVNPRDPAVFMLMPALVFLVALLASWIPTTRALKVDPATALRVE